MSLSSAGYQDSSTLLQQGLSAASRVHTAIGVDDSINSSDLVESLENEMLALSDQLTRTFEELSLIHDLSRNTQLDCDRDTHCRQALERLAPCLPADTLCVVLTDPPDNLAEVEEESCLPTRPTTLLEGQTRSPASSLSVSDDFSSARKTVVQCGKPIEEEFLHRIVQEMDDHRMTVANHPMRCAPHIDRVALVDLEDGVRESGRLVVIGTQPCPELGTIEVQLMQSVGMILNAQLAMHRQFESMRRMFEGTVRALVSAIDAKDPYTCGHSSRVSELSVGLATDYGLPHEDIETVRMAGLLHDIGKIGVSDAVLRKPGRLTAEEFDEIKKHPELGYQILRGVPQFSAILPGVRYHHESWNGKGYPAGLAGHDIPLIARILAVADAFDAMTSTRPYRNGMPLGRVIDVFIEGCGAQWDPDIVALLLEDEERMARMIDEGIL